MIIRFLPVVISLFLCLPSARGALVIEYLSSLLDYGAEGTADFSSDGYDLYGTSTEGSTANFLTTNLQNGRLNSGGGARPSYVSSITANGVNRSYGAAGFGTVADPASVIAQKQAGFWLNRTTSTGAQDLLDLSFSLFLDETIYITIVGGMSFHNYLQPSSFTLSGNQDGASATTGTIAQQDNNLADYHVFAVSGITNLTTLTIAGTETNLSPDSGNYYVATSGVLFSAVEPVPEPNAVYWLAPAAFLVLGRSLRRPRR